MRMSRVGVTPRTALRIPRPFIPLYNRYKYEIMLCGATHEDKIRVREQFRMILKTPLGQTYLFSVRPALNLVPVIKKYNAALASEIIL
jgi:hypothetical protein